METTLIHQGLQEKGEILFYQRTLFIGESEGHVKEGSVNCQLSSQAPCRGTWRGGHLLGTVRDSNIWAPFSWTQMMLGVLSLGVIWNFSKGTGLSWLGIRVWGTKGLSKGLGASGPKGLEPSYYSTLSTLSVDVGMSCIIPSAKVISYK